MPVASSRKKRAAAPPATDNRQPTTDNRSTVTWSVETGIDRSPRVAQIEGIFDVPHARKSSRTWSVDMPIDAQPWNVGLIVGPSGAGKSTLARKLWPAQLAERFDWPARKAVVDAFPEEMEAREVSALLSAVGFASPPAWLRPFGALSNGEQFRVDMARRLASGLSPTPLAVSRSDNRQPTTDNCFDPIVVDEFTSVVDRQVAQVGSAAVAREVRKRGMRFVAVTCHYDVIDWLNPDWIVEPHQGEFSWRHLRRRPPIELDIRSAAKDWRRLWKLFGPHHYLSSDMARNSHKFVAEHNGRPVAFCAVLFFPHPSRSGWREHRTVCLPDFQGIGIGNALSDWVASVFTATGYPYRSTTSSPAMIRRRAASRDWKMVSRPTPGGKHTGGRNKTGGEMRKMKSAFGRIVAGFEYVGPARHHIAQALHLAKR